MNDLPTLGQLGFQRHSQVALHLPIGTNDLIGTCDPELFQQHNLSYNEIIELAIHLLPNYHWACDHQRMDLYYEEAVYLFSELGMKDLSGYADALVNSLQRMSQLIGNWISPKLLSAYEKYEPSYRLLHGHSTRLVVGLDIH